MKLLKKLWKRFCRACGCGSSISGTKSKNTVTGPRKEITLAELAKNPMYMPPQIPWGLVPERGPITEHLHPLRPCAEPGPLVGIDLWTGTDPRLPRECPLCNGPNTPSRIDDRMVACFACKQVFLTNEAFSDPNIQRDMTHAGLGIRCSGRNDNNDCKDNDEKNDS